jgi:DNA-binding CsgD family transcriptional regulator
MTFDRRGGEALLDRIYEAAYDDLAFRELNRTVGELLQIDNVSLGVFDEGGHVETSRNETPEQWADYVAYYHAIDPWASQVMAMAPGTLAYEEALLPFGVARETEFYLDFSRFRGVHRPMCGVFPLEEGSFLGIGLAQDDPHFAFGEADWRPAMEAARHLVRALKMRRRLGAGRAAAPRGVGEALCNAVTFGMALVAEDGRVAFANAALETLCGAPGAALRLSRGRLAAAAPGQAERLSAVLAQACRRGRGGAVMLPVEGGRNLSVLVTPAASAGDALHGRLAVVAVGDAPAHQSPSLLSELFGLTAAESEIAAVLATGASPRQVAEQRSVKSTTLKTQLESIYAKMGVADGRQLQHRLGRLPQVGPPPGRRG